MIKNIAKTAEEKRLRENECARLRRANLSPEDREKLLVKERERDKKRYQKRYYANRQKVLAASKLRRTNRNRSDYSGSSASYITQEQFKKFLIADNKDINIFYLDRYLKFVLHDYKASEGYELHHILLRSCYPKLSNNPYNIVKLPVKAHLLAHWILAKALPKNHKVTSALFYMINNKNYSNISSRAYEFSRKIIIEDHKRRLAEGTHQFSDRKAHSQMLKSRAAAGNHVFLGGKIQRESNLRRSANGTNPFKGVKPWEHPRANSNSIEAWKFAPEIVEYIKSNPSEGYRNISKHFTDNFGFKVSDRVIVSMLKRVNNGWFPCDDADWIKFYRGD